MVVRPDQGHAIPRPVAALVSPRSSFKRTPSTLQPRLQRHATASCTQQQPATTNSQSGQRHELARLSSAELQRAEVAELQLKPSRKGLQRGAQWQSPAETIETEAKARDANTCTFIAATDKNVENESIFGEQTAFRLALGRQWEDFKQEQQKQQSLLEKSIESRLHAMQQDVIAEMQGVASQHRDLCSTVADVRQMCRSELAAMQIQIDKVKQFVTDYCGCAAKKELGPRCITEVVIEEPIAQGEPSQRLESKQQKDWDHTLEAARAWVPQVQHAFDGDLASLRREVEVSLQSFAIQLDAGSRRQDSQHRELLEHVASVKKQCIGLSTMQEEARQDELLAGLLQPQLPQTRLRGDNANGTLFEEVQKKLQLRDTQEPAGQCSGSRALGAANPDSRTKSPCGDGGEWSRAVPGKASLTDLLSEGSPVVSEATMRTFESNILELSSQIVTQIRGLGGITPRST